MVGHAGITRRCRGFSSGRSAVVDVARGEGAHIGVAAAQQDVIKQRKDLMKANGDQAKIGAAMVKGEKPFDLAAAQKIFATFEDAASKMPNLFPDNSKPPANSTDDFNAGPMIWETCPTSKTNSPSLGKTPRPPVRA